MPFAQTLNKLMAERGLSNYQLSKDLDVHPTTIANWLDGKMPRKKTLVQIARYFSVTVDRLTGEDELVDQRTDGSVTDSVLKAAFFGGEKELTPEQIDDLWADVREYAAFKAAQKKGKNG